MHSGDTLARQSSPSPLPSCQGGLDKSPLLTLQMNTTPLLPRSTLPAFFAVHEEHPHRFPQGEQTTTCFTLNKRSKGGTVWERRVKRGGRPLVPPEFELKRKKTQWRSGRRNRDTRADTNTHREGNLYGCVGKVEKQTRQASRRKAEINTAKNSFSSPVPPSPIPQRGRQKTQTYSRTHV